MKIYQTRALGKYENKTCYGFAFCTNENYYNVAHELNGEFFYAF